MIKSFKDKRTQFIFNGQRARGLPEDIQQRVRLKLRMLNAAFKLDDLRIPPSNRLEVLRGGRKGQHSIRVNDQWRICFKWEGKDATNVELVDYH